jgi:putative glutamine amidotransferase
MKILLAIDPAQPIAAYRDALLAGGALPEEAEVVQPGDPLPAEFDGLLLSGGVDVDPARYGETAVNGSVETNTGRDDLDFELLRRARAIGAAVFGICRGLQVVNVAFGGTLWQDLPVQRPRGVEHSWPRHEGNHPAHPAHVVRVARGVEPTLPLASALAATDGMHVNSRHHQAVKDLATVLVPLAASPDDLVEAFAHETAPFLAAVQWHPENLVDRPEQRALFADFLGAARRRAERTRTTASSATIPEPAVGSSPAPSEGAGGRSEGNDTILPGSDSWDALAAPPVRRAGKGLEPA